MTSMCTVVVSHQSCKHANHRGGEWGTDTQDGHFCVITYWWSFLCNHRRVVEVQHRMCLTVVLWRLSRSENGCPRSDPCQRRCGVYDHNLCIQVSWWYAPINRCSVCDRFSESWSASSRGGRRTLWAWSTVISRGVFSLVCSGMTRWWGSSPSSVPGFFGDEGIRSVGFW
jgi:hypothetical protein